MRANAIRGNPGGRIIHAWSRPSIWLLAMATLLMVINERQLVSAAIDTGAESSSTSSHSSSSESAVASGEKILSRKRRYLVFPQGTSLQLVYDMVYPILDKANVAYIGITGAMAYRLPSDPFHLDEDFANAISNGGFAPLDRTEDAQDNVVGTTAADTQNNTNYERRPVDTYYKPQQPSDNPVRPDDSFYKSRPQQQQQQPQALQSPAQQYTPFAPSRKDTYLLGGPDAPKDKYYAPGQGGPPPNRYYTNGGRNPGPPEKGVIDKFSNKMDYYFSYADKVLRTIKGMADKKVDPWKNVQWKVNEFAKQNQDYYNRRVSEAYPARRRPPSSFTTSGAAAPAINRSGAGFVPGNRQHAVHPVFGRRKRRTAPTSVNPKLADVGDGGELDDLDAADVDEALLEPLTEMDKYHLHLHRTSRHHLYQRIARLIEMNKMNGPECVKRALCETRRQRVNAQPDAFLVEIMRAVFTLPRAVKASSAGTADAMHLKYDEAHFVAGDRKDEDCAAVYPECEGSIWSDTFRM